MAEKNYEILDSLFNDLDYEFTEKVSSNDRMPITLWVPKEYHTKYERIQELSHKKFGKKLKEIVKQSIDLVDEKFV
jgi:hypothetical protein